MCSLRRTPGRVLRKMLARVALRTSIGSRRRSAPFSSSRSNAKRLWFVPAVAEQVEGSHPLSSQRRRQSTAESPAAAAGLLDGQVRYVPPRASIMLDRQFRFAAKKCTSCGGVCGLHMSPWKPFLARSRYRQHDRKAGPREPPGRRHRGKGSAVLETRLSIVIRTSIPTRQGASFWKNART
jgi:hypothetical protein